MSRLRIRENPHVQDGDRRTVQGPTRAGMRAAIARQLAMEFDGVLPPAAVEAIVEEAAAELRGQVPPASLDEMVHRLAGYRLREKVEAGR